MIYHVFGTINKRIEVGYNKATDTLFIKANSNCIEFSYEEMQCVMSILTICHNIPFDQAKDYLSRRNNIDLWEPSPPFAGETI